jgi:putative DNA primase/helicase
MGSFESMTATIGRTLASVGVEGWLGNLDRFRANQCDERAEWSAWIAAWFVRFGDRPQVARTLAETALSNDPDDLAFGLALPTVLNP